MKGIMLSIQPKWCEKIASGEKSVDVRKTRPKIETPFKCYIYQTKGIVPMLGKSNEHWKTLVLGKGKVIGEFVCDAIISHCEMANADIAEYQGCIRREKLFEYANGKELYGWHISDLVIYDKPKELGEFTGLRKTKFGYEPIKITRPPQSWCYVEVQE